MNANIYLPTNFNPNNYPITNNTGYTNSTLYNSITTNPNLIEGFLADFYNNYYDSAEFDAEDFCEAALYYLLNISKTIRLVDPETGATIATIPVNADTLNNTINALFPEGVCLSSATAK